MSTKKSDHKNTFKNQEIIATRELRRNKKQFDDRTRRITRQVRIDEGLHKKIRYAAFENGMTMSKYLDSLVLSADKQVHPHK